MTLGFTSSLPSYKKTGRRRTLLRRRTMHAAPSETNRTADSTTTYNDLRSSLNSLQTRLNDVEEMLRARQPMDLSPAPPPEPPPLAPPPLAPPPPAAATVTSVDFPRYGIPKQRIETSRKPIRPTYDFLDELRDKMSEIRQRLDEQSSSTPSDNVGQDIGDHA